MTYQQNIDVTAATIAAPAVTFDRAPLFAALEYINKHIVERRNTYPILANVLIEATSEGMARLIAPVDPQSDAIAALVARVEALESAIERQATPPSGEIADFAPLPHDPRALSIIRGKQEIAAADTLSVQSKPKRTAAHVRAIMAYLATRKERRIFRDAAEQMMKARDNLQDELQRALESLKIVQTDSIRWQKQDAAREKADYVKRRRAVKTAREFQQRLYAEYKIADQRNERHDRADEKHWAARDKMGLELRAAQEESQRLQALNDLRVREYCGIIDDLGTVGAKRRRAVIAARTRSQAALQLGKALVASMAESERLKRVAYQQAGHIVNVAERLDRAETQLRKHGPALTIVPPITLAVPVAA